MSNIIKSAGVGLVLSVVLSITVIFIDFLNINISIELLSVILAFGVLITMLHYWNKQQLAQINFNKKVIKQKLSKLERNVEEIHGLARLTEYNDTFPLPFGGGWALTADSAALMVREIILHNPRTVVELGSGVSTILLGKVLKKSNTNAKIISLDHDKNWADKTKSLVEKAGLEDIVEVKYAPLQKYQIDDSEYNWYELPEELKELDKIDALIIDGPPHNSNPQGKARYPAMPILHPKLAQNSIVYVDDASRKDEKEMVDLWMKDDSAWELETFDTADGVAVLKRS